MINKANSLQALLPLRGGSKGIPKKNIKLFCGYPLYYWTAKAVCKANIPLNISTEDQEITSVVEKYTPSAKIIKRPKKFAQDASSTEDVVKHFITIEKCEHILLIQATSPLTNESHIKEAVNLYFKNNCKPLISGTFQHNFIWNKNGIPNNYDPIKRPRRQDWEGEFIENGSLYLFSKKDFLRSECRCVPPCTLFKMDEIHSFEIDTLNDWIILENLMKNNRSE